MLHKGKLSYRFRFSRVSTGDKPVNGWISSSAVSERGRENTPHQDPQPNVLAMGNNHWWSPKILLCISCHTQPCFLGCHLYYKEVRPDLNWPVIQSCTPWAWASHWARDRTAQSQARGIYLNHCKCDHTPVQHFCLVAELEEKYEKALSHAQLFSVLATSSSSWGGLQHGCSSTCPSPTPGFSNHKLIQRARVQ